MRHYPYVISSVLMNCFHFLIFFVFFLFIFFFFFFFNDTATTEIYTLSLHDALPISAGVTSRGYLNWWVLLGGDTPHLPLQNVLCIRLGSQCVLPAENDQLTHHLNVIRAHHFLLPNAHGPLVNIPRLCLATRLSYTS